MSYRNYVPRSLDRVALSEKNRNAPKDHKFCNAFCFDYLSTDRFSGPHVICNKCRNMILMAEKLIAQNQLTVENFQKDPMIVYGEDAAVRAQKKCDTCNQQKDMTNFEFNRYTCKSCRYLQSSARAKERVNGFIHDIENLKTNIPVLENYVKSIPKDSLILIIAHYRIGRKPTDVKSTIVLNIIQYFKQLMDPTKCRSCCGSVVPPHVLCGKCETKRPSKQYEQRQRFMDNIDNVFGNLKPLDIEKDFDLFNKDELSMLARKAKLQFEQILKKRDLFVLFNDFLINREEEKKKQQAEEELKKKKMITVEDLVIENFRIQSRSSDGYINATQLCKAGGKLFADWYRLENTKAFVKALGTDMGIPITDLINIIQGGNAQGSWIHPDLATNLAQWISHPFGIRVARWVREIVLTGKASFEPKSNDALIKLQMELQEKNDQLKRLEVNHKKLLMKREYHKFKNGSCLYIIKADPDHLKVGISDNLGERFATYRTSIPNMKVLYVIYTSRAGILEQCLLSRYSDYRVESNHEFLSEISLLELTSSIDTICKFMKFDSSVVPEEEIEAYNG